MQSIGRRLRGRAIKASVIAAALVFTSIGVVVFASGPADAATSCGYSNYSHSGTARFSDGSTFHVSGVQYCPIWKANTPVYNNARGSKFIVGYLTNSGDGNWFVCQLNVDSYSAYGYTSKNWAMTEADNGKWGWTPAVYFAGSQNYWAGLLDCGQYENP
jgi:hypothetical protein